MVELKQILEELTGIPGPDRLKTDPAVTTQYAVDGVFPKAIAFPKLLGPPNGVVDLLSGTLRAGRPEDMLSLRTRVPYDPSAQAPLWEATLAAIFPDPDVLAYVQRAAGYTLTGDCREEAFLLLYGQGANGKGTLINTLAWVLGDYATDLAMSSLEMDPKGTSGAAATPDLAKLPGRRLVTAE